MDAQELSARLEKSFLLHRKHAATFLKKADPISVGKGSSPQELLLNYGIRLQHLRRLANDHDTDLPFKNLYHSTAELVTNLRKVKPLSCSWVLASHSGIQEYMIIMDEATSLPLACVQTRPHNKLLSMQIRNRDIDNPAIQ